SGVTTPSRGPTALPRGSGGSRPLQPADRERGYVSCSVWQKQEDVAGADPDEAGPFVQPYGRGIAHVHNQRQAGRRGAGSCNQRPPDAPATALRADADEAQVVPAQN